MYLDIVVSNIHYQFETRGKAIAKYKNLIANYLETYEGVGGRPGMVNTMALDIDARVNTKVELRKFARALGFTERQFERHVDKAKARLLAS